MYEKSVLSAIVAVSIMLLVSCGAQTTSPASTPINPSDVVAKIDDMTITGADLDAAVKGRLQKVDQEIYEIKKDALDDLIDKKLIEAAAKKQGKSVDEFMKENIDNKASAPTEDEIKNFYEARKEQMGGKSLKEASDQIRSYLTQSRKQGAKQQLLNGLRASSNVKINLEPPRIKVEVGDNPTIGPKDAPVTIIEFTDYQCPFCSRVRSTINQLIGEYKDKIRYALRDFPLPFHQFAKKAHEAAHCAGDQGKYWEYSKELWANQQALQVEKLKEYAKNLKLNTGKFNDCLDKGKYTKFVEENVAYGSSVGAQGTPSFFINGIFFSGARPIADFKEVIDRELKQ